MRVIKGAFTTVYNCCDRACRASAEGMIALASERRLASSQRRDQDVRASPEMRSRAISRGLPCIEYAIGVPTVKRVESCPHGEVAAGNGLVSHHCRIFPLPVRQATLFQHSSCDAFNLDSICSFFLRDRSRFLSSIALCTSTSGIVLFFCLQHYSL